MPGWNEDSPELQGNLDAVIRRVREQAERRIEPTLGLMREWHREMMAGLDVPHADYVGRFRGDATSPVLEDCRVRVGDAPGAPPEDVATQLAAFENGLQGACALLDERIGPGSLPDEAEVLAVLELCGRVHAGWVRIHPFANGNGRTARLWANFVAVRYGLPVFVRLRPRPDGAAYGVASRAAMIGHYQPTVDLFRIMFHMHMQAWDEDREPGQGE